MSKYTLSPWHDGSAKPVNVGVYQTKINGDVVSIYQYWNGEFWGYRSWHKDDAAIGGSWKSAIQNPKWRGILKD